MVNLDFMINGIYLHMEKKTSILAAGKKRFIASVNGWKVNLQICYDLRFPRLVYVNPGQRFPPQTPEYDLLIVVANWPSVRSHAWRILLQARAIENQCYVIGVNRTGTTEKDCNMPASPWSLGPLGEPIKILGAEEEIFSHTLDREKLEEVRLKFPFWRDADDVFHSTINYEAGIIWQTKYLQETKHWEAMLY